MCGFKEKKIKIVVRSSKCDFYKPGDTIYIDHAMVDKERSANICLTALNAIYPFIYAARKNVTLEQMGFRECVFNVLTLKRWLSSQLYSMTRKMMRYPNKCLRKSSAPGQYENALLRCSLIHFSC